MSRLARHELRGQIRSASSVTRAPLKAFCRRIAWVKIDGGLKDVMARVTMLAMHRPAPIVFGPDTEPPQAPASTTLNEVRPLSLRPVVLGDCEGKRWNEFVARYHYHAHPALDHHPQSGLAHPCHRPPALAGRLDRTLQLHARAHRGFRRDPALDWLRLQRIRPDLCRNHEEARALRHGQALQQAEEGHLAPAPQKRLKTNPQPLKVPAAITPRTPRPHENGFPTTEHL